MTGRETLAPQPRTRDEKVSRGKSQWVTEARPAKRSTLGSNLGSAGTGRHEAPRPCREGVPVALR